MADTALETDLLVIGAGPAGAAAARVLAAAGCKVTLADAAPEFPRDKVCGDALIPDACQALERLGLFDAVHARGYRAEALRLHSDRGVSVLISGRSATLPRAEFDHILFRAACDAGASPMLGARLAGLNREAEAVEARFLRRDGSAVSVRARRAILATGAASGPLRLAGVALPDRKTLVAVRQYVRHPELAAATTELQFFLDGSLRGGYAWAFPGPDGVFNVGAGLRQKRHDLNVRGLFEHFRHRHPWFQALYAGGEVVSPLKGAPLVVGLSGARPADGPLLVAGEALGTTFPLTGEGIGKALETGILAAETLLEGGGTATAEATAAAYTGRVAALKAKYRAYEIAEMMVDRPWLGRIIVRKAARSERLRARMSAVFAETADPSRLFSVRGLLRLLWI